MGPEPDLPLQRGRLKVSQKGREEWKTAVRGGEREQETTKPGHGGLAAADIY